MVLFQLFDLWRQPHIVCTCLYVRIYIHKGIFTCYTYNRNNMSIVYIYIYVCMLYNPAVVRRLESCSGKDLGENASAAARFGAGKKLQGVQEWIARTIV